MEKRNRILQNQSEYLNMLARINVGNNYSVSGNLTESNFFEYIARYCKMEIAVHKRNKAMGNISPKIEEKLQNPLTLNTGHLARIRYCNSIIWMCTMDRVKEMFKK